MTEQIEKSKTWYQDSILVKLGVITIIILTLLIPSSWIQDLVSDREGYQQQMMANVADKWSGSQLVQGPILVIPYKRQVTETSTNNTSVSRQTIGNIYVLPQALQIKAGVKTEKFEKGIYDAIVYNSTVQLQGNFMMPDIGLLGINPADVMYDKARLVFGLSDLKGLKNTPVIKIQNQNYTSEPANGNSNLFSNNLQVNFPLQKDTGFTFSYALDIKGSNDLNFLNIAKTTDVEINSDWKSPDFNGRFLPDTRDTTDKGFKAKWHTSYYNRPFPQQWINDDYNLSSKKAIAEALFGIRLQLPIDQYHKVMRTTKYSLLIILLTFVSLFMTEMIKKLRIHLFNYTLIGAAMVVYYTLLLSFSEQIGYNYAYLLSSVSTITLIAAFTAAILKNRNMAGLFAFILSIFYGFIFIIIQLETLSLLFGSIALFLIIAALMYFSLKINWDKH